MRLVALVALGALALSACSDVRDLADDGSAVSADEPRPRSTRDAPDAGAAAPGADTRPGPAITLAFAGDVHFEGALAAVPGRPRSTLGEMSQDLRAADLAMVNLESPVTTRGSLASKELEVAGNRYWFRSDPQALDLLDRSGVDVVSVANNHGGDYGVTGLLDTVRAGDTGPVAVVGAGRDHVAAHTPYRETIKGTDVAVFAADASFRESDDAIWGVLPGSGPGIASARVPYTKQLTTAVRAASLVDDVVVVYLHWGEEGEACSTVDQQTLASELAAAGADIVVGAHSHLLMGSGLLGDTYVSYGLGNFYWYNGAQSDSGVLELTVRDGAVVAERWRPATIGALGGAPTALDGRAGREAIADWRELRGCTDLAPGPRATPRMPTGPAEPAEPAEPARPAAPAVPQRPAYASTIGPIGARLREQMIGTSHFPATCPVGLDDLRRLTMSYVDFGGESRTGAMVVHRDVAREVVAVFGSLYDAGFRIRQMKLVDLFDGDDNASMAANNTSAYNCRTVAGSSTFSDHAYGKAIDINPVQNPYVLGSGVVPPAGEAFADVDRSPRAPTTRGVIASDDVVTRAFARAGWEWGAVFSEPDYQHFSTS